MRKLLSAAAAAAALLCAPAFAQEAPPAAEGQPAPSASEPPPPARGEEPAPLVEGESPPPTEGQAAPRPVPEEPPKNVISTAPTNLLVGVYSVEYERVLSPNLAVFVSPSYLNNTASRKLQAGGQVETATAGFRGILGARLYTESRAPAGFFLGAQVLYDNTTGLSTFTDVNGTRFPSGITKTVVYGAGAMLGYDILLGRHVQISLGFIALLQQTRTIIAAADGTVDSDRSEASFVPAGRVNIGFAF
jgi:hypothetical protein